MLLALFFYTDKSTEYNNFILGKDATANKPPDLNYDFIIGKIVFFVICGVNCFMGFQSI